MFRRKTEYISELLETIIYAAQEKSIIKCRESLNKESIIRVLFGIEPETYHKYLKQCNKKDNEKDENAITKRIASQLNKVRFDSKTLAEHSIVGLYVNEKGLLKDIKQILNDYKNDLGYNDQNLEKIDEFKHVRDLYKYIFSDAYDDNEKMLIINPNLSDLSNVLRLKLNHWKKQNLPIVNIDTIKKSRKFLKLTIRYAFNSDKNDSFPFYVYIYTGVELDADLSRENNDENGVINLTDPSLSLICVFNPYYNWVKSEDYISNNKYITYIKESDFSYKILNDFIVINGVNNLVLINQLSQAIIDKIESYSGVVLKHYIYKSPHIIKEKAINQSISNVKFKLIQEMVKNQSNHIEKKALLVGEYSISTIAQYAQYYSIIYLFSNSKEYIDYTYNQWEKNYPNSKSKLITSCFYLGIADSKVASKYKNFDLIVVGNGNGSFFKKINKYFLYFNFMLKDDGILLFSVFNPSFNYDGLSSKILYDNLLYVYKDGQIYYKADNADNYTILRLKGYSHNNIKQRVERFFKVKSEMSYPMFAFTNSFSNTEIEKIKLAMEESFVMLKPNDYIKDYNGYFLTFIATKESSCNTEPNLEKDIPVINHNAIFNKTVQVNSLIKMNSSLTEKNFLKVLLLKSEENQEEIAVLITFYGKFLPVGENKLLQNKSYKFLSIREINKLGYEVANISPFVLSKIKQEHRYYDKKLDRYYKTSRNKVDSDKMVVYFGSNDCDKTCYMNISEFVELLKKHEFTSVEV